MFDKLLKKGVKYFEKSPIYITTEANKKYLLMRFSHKNKKQAGNYTER